jgi:zinc protease
MKNKNLLKKVIFVAVLLVIVFSLLAPAIFSQTPKQEKLLNGLKVLMWNDAKSDKVSIRLRIHSGSAFDPQGKEGVMRLLADSIFPNAESRVFFVEDLGGDLEVNTNYDFIEVNASSRPEGFLTMIETVATAVSNPTIDKETTTALRNALAAKVAALEDDPVYVADQAVANRLLGNFPYGRPELGTTDSLDEIGFADLIDAKQRFLTADNATVAVSGNFDRSLAFRAIRRYFGGWLKSDKQVPLTFRQPDDPVAGVHFVASPKPDTSVVRFAIRGVARNDKQLPASMVYAEILRQRLRSRLSSLKAEDIFVRSDAHGLPGVIVIGYTTKPVDGRAEIDLNDVIARLLAEPVTAAEFNAGKASFSQTWSRKDRESFWLDADTYKIASPESDARIAERVTLSEVNAYSEKVRRSPIAKVLLHPPLQIT